MNKIQPTYQIDTEDGYDMVKNSYFYIGVIINGEHIDYYNYSYFQEDQFGNVIETKNLIPSGFAESSESHYEFRGPVEKAVDILKQCGYIEFTSN